MLQLLIARSSTSSPNDVVAVRLDSAAESLPVATDLDQAWFWTDEWLAGEDLVDDHIERGEYEEVANMDDFLRSLGFNE